MLRSFMGLSNCASKVLYRSQASQGVAAIQQGRSVQTYSSCAAILKLTPPSAKAVSWRWISCQSSFVKLSNTCFGKQPESQHRIKTCKILRRSVEGKQNLRQISSMAANAAEKKADEVVAQGVPSGLRYEMIGKSGVKLIDISAKGLEVTAKTISGLSVNPLTGPSAFVKPNSIHFQQGSRKRRWDMVESHPSVSICLYHKGLEAVLLVRQFRPAVYIAETNRVQREEGITAPLPFTAAFTYELCAGIVDKPALKLEEIAKEEIREECGYDVPLASIQKLTSWLSAVGISGARQTCYYAEIDESMRVSRGGGNLVEGEEIDVVALPVNQIDKFTMDDSIPKSTGVMWATTWLLAKLKDEESRQKMR